MMRLGCRGPSAPSSTSDTARAAIVATTTTTTTAAPAYCATMASLRVIVFDHEGRPAQFDTWLDNLQLYLLSDIKDGVSLFDHVSGAATAPPTTADSATRSQWLSRDAAARLAIRNHLPLAECAHFGQHRTTQALYDAVVAPYSSPATAALGRLLLPNLFPELSAFATVEDLNHPPTFITLYFIVTRLPDSLRSVRHHFFSLDPTSLTVDLLEQHLLAGETCAVAVGAARGTSCPPFFEGCSPSPLAPSYASAAAVDVSDAEDVGAASASAKRRSSKGKGGKGGGGGSGGGGGGSGSSGGGSSGGGGGGGTGGGSGGFGGGSGGSGGSGGGGGSGTSGGGTGARRVGSGGGKRQQQQCRSETQSPQQLRDHAGQTCGRLHTQHRCFSRLDDAWRAEFGEDVELPQWADLLRSRIAIFDLDFDAILSAMYALSVSVEGDSYRCVPPDPGIATAALGGSEYGTLPGTALAQALHTFMLDSGASACFFRDSTTLTPLSTPVPVRLAHPSGGPVVARSSSILPCPAVPSGSLSGLHLPSFSANLVSTAALQDAMVTTTTPGGQRVTICTCTRTGRHLAMFTRRPGSSLYTLATEPPQVAASVQVSAPGQVAASCSCRLLSHQTLLWHHRLGHPSLPRLRGMHSRLVVSGLPRSLPPLPPSPAPPCLPCVEGWQRAAPHSSSFPPTTAPLQTLYMDVWGPARFSGQSRERYFPQVVDDYTRGGEFSSNLLRDFCRGEGILQSFTLPDSPQQTGIAERHISLVMEVARTSMIHAASPHFLWPFAVRYAAHQLNLWPRVSLPETPPTLRWTGEDSDALVFKVWGSRAFVRDTSADKLSPRAIPCVFLGFVPDAPGWQFYHPTSRRVFPSENVTFDESVPVYRLFPYRSAPLPPQGPAPSGVSQVDPLLGPAPVQVAVDSGAARGAASGGIASGGAEPGVAESEGAETGGAEPGGVETGGAEHEGAEPKGVEPGSVEPEGTEHGDAASEGAGSRGAEPQGAASSGGSAGASRRLSPQQLPKAEAVEGVGAAGRLRSRLYGCNMQQDSSGSTAAPAGPRSRQQKQGQVAAGAAAGGATVAAGWQLQMLDCFPTTLSYPPPHSSTSGSERERRGGCWFCRISLATLSHSPRFPSPSPRNLSPPLTADPAEGRGRTGCWQLTPATPTSPSPHGGSCGREGGDGVSCCSRRCWRTRPCAGAHGRTRLRAAMRTRTQLRAATAVFVTERATGVGGAGAAGAGGAQVVAGAGVTGGTATTGPGGARTRGTGAAGAGVVEGAGAGDPTESGATGADGSDAGGSGAEGAGVGGIGAAGAGVGDTGAGGAGAVALGGAVRPRPYFIPLLQQSGGLTKRRKPASRPVLLVHTAPCIPHSRPPLLPGTHAMALRPSSVPLRVPLPAPPESSLPEAPSPESDRARSASPSVSRLLATTVTDPSFESAAAYALIAELLDFATAYRLDYATALVAESASATPPSIGGECALGMDVLEDRQEDFEFLAAAVPRFASMLLAPEGDPDAPDIPTPCSYAEAITGPYSSLWQAPMDAEMASWKSTGTYVDEVPSPGANIVDGIQRQGVDFFQTFSPTLKMTTLRVLLHVAAQRDYELHSLDFRTAFLQGSLHEEISLRRPPGFTESFPAGTQWSLRRLV
ncbi:unnamed protein product [Closterium sp. NIES-54]